MVAWLGVTYYLTAEAIAQTLDRVRTWTDATLVLDYFLDEGDWEFQEPWGAAWFASLGRLRELGGEPWISYFSRVGIDSLLHDHGFRRVEHLEPDVIARDYLAGTDLIVDPRMAVVRASTGGFAGG